MARRRVADHTKRHHIPSIGKAEFREKNMSIHMPPGVKTLTMNDDKDDTHPVKLHYEYGRQTEAKSVIWNDEPAPEGVWKIDDERQVKAD